MNVVLSYLPQTWIIEPWRGQLKFNYLSMKKASEDGVHYIETSRILTHFG